MGCGSMEKLLQLAWYSCLALSLTGIRLSYMPRLCWRRFCANFQVMAVDLSRRLGWIDDSIVKRVHNILTQAKLPTAPAKTMTVEMFKSVMAVRYEAAILF
jgi:hypothetical protein